VYRFIVTPDPTQQKTQTHSVGLLWTSDETEAANFTGHHTTLKTEIHPCPRRDSNSQSHQANGRKTTP